MNVKETFLALTKFTYPFGNEYLLRRFLPDDISVDKHGNYYYKIGDSKTIFTSHLDTANNTYGPVVHVIDDNIIKTDGNTILGADDKAGVTVLLYLIYKEIPGTYYFFIGEEVGCIGSKAASKDPIFGNYDRIVSFDRRNTCSIITYQQGSRCCSDRFANALSEEYKKFGLDLIPDDTGLVTDSAQFTDTISECTNISVGYYCEHTHEERQDIAYLTRLCEASILVDWESLPKVRNPKVNERKYYHNHNHNSNFPNRGGYTNHRNRGKNYHYGHSDLFSHSYNEREELIDRAMMEDDIRNRRLKKKLKKEHKNKYKQEKKTVFVEPSNIKELIREHNKEDRDPYATFKEYLTQSAYASDLTLLTEEEYDIIFENKVVSL